MFSSALYEEVGSPTESWEATGLSVQASYVVAWSARKTLVQELLAAGGHVYPRYPAMNCRAQKATVRPYSARQNGATSYGGVYYAQYDSALITVDYKTGKREETTTTSNGTTLVSEKLGGTAEFLTLDPASFQWSGGDSVSDDEAPGLQIRGLDYELTYHDVDSIPLGVFDLQGCVNDASVTAHTLGKTFGEQTLMLGDVSADRAVKTDGAEAWKVTMQFGYRRAGWNKFWRATTQAWETLQVYNASTLAWEDYNSYPPEDFSSLF